MRHQHDDDTRTGHRSRGQRHDVRDDRQMFGWDDDRQRHHRSGRSGRSSDDFRRRWENDRNLSARDERDSEYGPDAQREGMPRDETERLIASTKVEGTPVYDRNGEKLGTICTLMMDKKSGRTEYAVLKYTSGFLGLSVNERYYPLDWRELTYDRRVQGYGVEFTEDQLQDRPGYDADGRRVRSRHGRRQERRSAGW